MNNNLDSWCYDFPLLHYSIIVCFAGKKHYSTPVTRVEKMRRFYKDFFIYFSFFLQMLQETFNF